MVKEKEKTIREKEKTIKCVIWDLDNTIWDGILLEDKDVCLKEGITDTIKALDERGILQSIASRNNYEDAVDTLRRFQLLEYFLYPQINWGNKSESIQQIIGKINIGSNTVAFIDDQPYELDEVKSVIPDIFCISAEAVPDILNYPRMIPKYITEDTKRRREMYLSDQLRNDLEQLYTGPQEEFQRSLRMKLSISHAKKGDLDRVIELTERTNQLNTTGYTYTYDELEALRQDSRYSLLIMGLEDKYGTYGKIGIVLLEKEKDRWVIDLFIMSCRVIARGVGTIVMNHIMKRACEAGVMLQARFIPTDRNKMMLLSYSLAGFRLKEIKDGYQLLENDLRNIREKPDYVELITEF